MASVLKQALGLAGSFLSWSVDGANRVRDLLTDMHADDVAIRDALTGMLFASVTNDFASLADGAGVSFDVTVPGAQLGDFCFPALGLTVQGITITAQVKAVDVVTVRLQNESTLSVDLASTTVYIGVLPLQRAYRVGLLGSATYDPASLLDAGGASTDVTVPGAKLGDFVVCSFGLDTQGIILEGNVKSNDTVTARFQNETTGTVDLASSKLRVLVIPRAVLLTQGLIATSATILDLADGDGVTIDVPVPGAKLGDFTRASITVDGVSMIVTSAVKQADVISVRIQNESNASTNLSAATLRAGVVPRSWLAAAPALAVTIE